MSNRAASSCNLLNTLLAGGLDTDIITTVYGPSGSGKTNVCMLFALGALSQGKKVIYMDTESNFSTERFIQMSADEGKKLLKQMLFLRPNSFSEQDRQLHALQKTLDTEIGLIVVDTISMLYRLEFGKGTDIQELNRELGRQVSLLSELSRRKKIPVLLASQVYSDISDKEEDRGKVKMLGGDLLKYGSKCLLELRKTPNGTRQLLIKKHRSIRDGNLAEFIIVDEGFVEKKSEK